MVDTCVRSRQISENDSVFSYTPLQIDGKSCLYYIPLWRPYYKIYPEAREPKKQKKKRGKAGVT
jgi:hypothetical protein